MEWALTRCTDVEPISFRPLPCYSGEHWFHGRSSAETARTCARRLGHSTLGHLTHICVQLYIVQSHSRTEERQKSDYLHATKHEWPDKLSLHLKCALATTRDVRARRCKRRIKKRKKKKAKNNNRRMLSVPCNYTNVCVVHFGVATRRYAFAKTVSNKLFLLDESKNSH